MGYQPGTTDSARVLARQTAALAGQVRRNAMPNVSQLVQTVAKIQQQVEQIRELQELSNGLRNASVQRSNFPLNTGMANEWQTIATVEVPKTADDMVIQAFAQFTMHATATDAPPTLAARIIITGQRSDGSAVSINGVPRSITPDDTLETLLFQDVVTLNTRSSEPVSSFRVALQMRTNNTSRFPANPGNSLELTATYGRALT